MSSCGRILEVSHKLEDGEQVGALFPRDSLYQIGEEKQRDLLKDCLLTKRAILFGVPGAFTPVCSSQHVPSFLEKEGDLLANHVDQIICTAVNDPFVMQHWRESFGSKGKSSSILFLADPLAKLAGALSLTQDLTSKGLGVRSIRYAMIIINGVIVWIGKDDQSFAQSCIDFLKAKGPFLPFELATCEGRAREALKNAHAIYHTTKPGDSNDEICGVAIHSDVGVTVGTTLQNCAYPSSICGVRAAVCIALSEGASRFFGMVVVGRGTSDQYPSICGQCKQSVGEFAPFTLVCMNSTKGQMHLKKCAKRKVTDQAQLFDSQFNRGRTPELRADDVTKFQPASVKPDESLKKLYDAAIAACATVYTPVSHFPVGAAFATDKGIFTGSNVELSSSIGSGLCAECVGLAKCVAGGARKIEKLVLLCYKLTDDFGTPCGKCRQTLIEFGDLAVHMLKLNPKAKTYEIRTTSTYELLPDCFKPSALGK